MPLYQISFTWDIHYACNYRCSYCFFSGQWHEVSKKDRYPGIKKWLDIWSRIYEKYGKCHIHISGGEPFMYPDFLVLISSLGKIHSLEFDTNLSFNVETFLAMLGSIKTTFNASYHPKFSNFDSFLEKVVMLKKNGHLVSINYVGYVPFLGLIKQYQDKCIKNNVDFRVVPFRGFYEGKMYPPAYTKSERELMRVSTKDDCTEVMENWYDSKSLFNAKEVNYERVCYLGHIYAKIHSDGTAYRCCIAQEEGKLGNLIDGTFSLWDEPRLCKYDRCSCWRAPIVGEERRWERYWQKTKG